MSIDCIIERHKGEASDEHIIPGAIGGRLITRLVCIDCNNKHCAKIDAAFVETPLMILARHQFPIAGYDVANKVFKSGTLPDGTHVNVKYDKGQGFFVSEIRGGKEKTENGDGTANIKWTMPPGTQPKDLIEAARKELAAHGETGLSDDEVLSRMTFQETTVVNPKVNIQYEIDLFALTLGGLKIAYEYAVETLGRDYSKDPAAEIARDLLIAGVPKTPAERSSFACSLGEMKINGAATPTPRHRIALIREDSRLRVVISLYNTFLGEYTMSTRAEVYAPFQSAVHDIQILTGERHDARIPAKPN